MNMQTAHISGITGDFLRKERNPLDAIFAPRTVALIGATERGGCVGRTILWNLLSNPFGGTIFPINPKRPNILGIKTYPSIAEVPDPVDLAIIVTPAPTVPGIIGECVEAGVPGAIIISAGFKETGPEGARLEEEILAQARRGRMRIIGPNCLGVMSPVTGLNATFAASMADRGHIAFISQSGALCTAVLDWSYREHVGFSHFVSIGSMLDVGWGDLIAYLGDDPETHAIVIYMETVGNARAFLSAAREVALNKPIIVIKAGRTAAAAKAAASHTGSLAGSDAVLDAAFRRVGVLRVDTIAELFDMAEVLAKQPRPKGRRLTLLTNAGGPGVLATDALIRGGGELAELGAETMAALDAFLPAAWSHNNPVDVLGDADPQRYAKALDVLARDPNTDGLLVILTPQAMTDPTETARQLVGYARLMSGDHEPKPLLASWMGGDKVAEGELILNRADIPTYPFPDTAAQVFNYMWQFAENLRALYETPVASTDPARYADKQIEAAALLRAAREQGRTLLTEAESKQILALYGIPTVETRIATTADEAVAAAEAIGYPVVVKLHSFTITHKTDVGGVRLNLADADAVRAAFAAIAAAVPPEAFQGVTVQPMVKLDGYELILGSSIDAQFGPVLLFGAGGQLVEVFKDSALGLPPLTTTLARRMIERTRIATALKGVRGRAPIDQIELEKLLVRFSQLVVEQPLIAEIDINPLLASPERLLALDARIVLHPPELAEEHLPKPAIRPYPTHYISTWTLPTTGETLVFRPIRAEDEPLMVEFHRHLSEKTVYLRYERPLRFEERVAHERLAQICFIDYDRQMALVAERTDPATGARELLGVARLRKTVVGDEAIFGLLVRDEYQGSGMGTALLTRLLEIARQEGIACVSATFLPENAAMARICRKLSFTLIEQPERGLVYAEKRLTLE
ncbi:MAG: GNAT family N-acetyltransferase [Caldilineales bacterium]|nr:GNAT family N-acetyltransferase [Caldilineales bacterium]